MANSGNPHILIFPFPSQGHMLPLVDLAHQLSLRSISITILITPKNLPILTPLLTTHPTIHTLILPFPTNPPHHHRPLIPSGVENAKDLPFSGFPDMIFTLGNLYDPILNWFKNHPSPPTAVVYDLFLGWMHYLCRGVGVCGYVFFPSGGLSLSIINSLWHDKPSIIDDDDGDLNKKKEFISFPKVPKSPSYPWWQISLVYRRFAENKEDPLCKFIESSFEGNLLSDGFILNAFDKMEENYLSHLKEVLGHERVWAVGPLFPLDDDDMARERGGSSLVPDDDIWKWVDKWEDRSVVYVCFGSQVVLSNEQMEALTKALDKSGVRFVLVYKGASKGHVDGVEKYGSIPSGFEERVSERGLLINGWAPQVMILKHPAVGAFLFHCGWNTVLENILLAGVPMLVWPMTADQYTNATLIVDELKIGVRVCEGLETVPDSNELARLLAKAIGELDQEKRRSRELHKVAMAAIKEGGSSFQGLNDLVAHLSQ